MNKLLEAAKMNPRPINIERARELFEYKDGHLIRRIKQGSRAMKGDIAGSLTKDGYIVIRVDGVLYRAHRLIYALLHDVDPADKQIDHIDGNRTNNQIENLRLATHAENLRNRTKLDANNTSGMRGVVWDKALLKWRAQLGINGKTIYGGVFTNIEDAKKRALSIRAEHFGNFKGK